MIKCRIKVINIEYGKGEFRKDNYKQHNSNNVVKY